MAARTQRRTRRARVDPVVKVELEILPEVQTRRGNFRLVDVQNRSDADQRDMVSLGRTKTVRRKTRIERMAAQMGLEHREAAACTWYADAHEARYGTLGVIGSYGESSKSGRTNFDHLPSTIEQDRAVSEFQQAREGISPPLRLMFDRIVLEGWEPKPETLFRLAIRQLMHTIESWVGLED